MSSGGGVGKIDSVNDLFDRVWHCIPKCRRRNGFEVESVFLLHRVARGDIERAILLISGKRHLGKIQPEFKKSADECKTHLGENLFST